MFRCKCCRIDIGVCFMQDINNGIVFLIYNENEININEFSIKKYIDIFRQNQFNCILLTEKNFKNQECTPLCVINRTNNFIIAQYFEKKGIRVFNNSFVTKICNNKLETYKYLKGIKHLKICDNKDITYPIVAKDPTSKGGKDVFLLENNDDFNKIYKRNMILQEFLPNACDIRTYIIGNEIILSVKRNSTNNFKANYKINHNAEIYTLNDDEKNMIKEILTKFKFDFVGIDILKNYHGFYFSEIEDSVGSRAVYDITNFDIIKRYVEYIVSQME